MKKDEIQFLSSFNVCYVSNKGKKFYTRDFLHFVNNDMNIAHYIFKEIKGEEILECINRLCKLGKLQFTNSGNYIKT